MRRLLSAGARGGLALTLALMVLAVLRWAPVHAQPPGNLRALPLAGPLVAFAVLAALSGGERHPRGARRVAAALAAAAAALAALVWVRGPRGLPLRVETPQAGALVRPPGPVDLVGSDLADLPRARRRTLLWEGALRPPVPGPYRLWVDGRGRVEVAVDGRTVLWAEGDPLRAGADVSLAPGRHHIAVRLEQLAFGPRLRLGWTRPTSAGAPGGSAETVPPRALGPEAPRGLWALVDLLALAVAALAGALAFLLPWERPRRLPAPAPPGAGEMWASLAGHAALAALMSWPLVLDLAGAGPLDRPDGRLNTWILAWDVHALRHEPARLFQAPIFHPLPDALAFTENLLLPAVVAAPAILLGTPVLGYNLVLLGSAAASGLAAQLLVRRVSGDALAAFVGGAAFGVGAHRWFRMAHLHAEVTAFLPLALLALDRFAAKPTLGRGLLVGLLLALQGLSSIYLGAITAMALAAAAVVGIAGGWRGRELRALGAGALLAAVLLAPLARPYLRMRAFQGMEFTLADEANYATTLASYAASPSRLYAPLTRRHMDQEQTRDPLFPGLALLALGIAGLAPAPRRYRAVALAASLLAVVLSLGPQTGFYRFLHEHVVLFRGIRALSRFSLIPVLALCVLAGLALSGRRFWTRVAALALLLAEAAQGPFRFAPYPQPSPASRWLAGRPGAVAELPLGPERDTDAMLDGLVHRRPLLNGDSGFIPRAYDRTRELLEAPAGADALRFLRAAGVGHLLSREELPLPVAARFGEQRIYAVPPGEPAAAAGAGRPTPALWQAGGAQLDLGEERPVAAVGFELSDAPWIARPRVELSADGRAWSTVVGDASLADAALALTRDPRRARGEVRLPSARARYLRLDPRLPARPGLLWVSP